MMFEKRPLLIDLLLMFVRLEVVPDSYTFLIPDLTFNGDWERYVYAYTEKYRDKTIKVVEPEPKWLYPKFEEAPYEYKELEREIINLSHLSDQDLEPLELRSNYQYPSASLIDSS